MTNAPERISRDEVRAIAKLAELDLREDEITRITKDLDRILAYVGELAAIDLEGVPPTSHGDLFARGLREDVEIESLSHEAALAEAPSIAEGGFAVPSFVDEG